MTPETAFIAVSMAPEGRTLEVFVMLDTIGELPPVIPEPASVMESMGRILVSFVMSDANGIGSFAALLDDVLPPVTESTIPDGRILVVFVMAGTAFVASGNELFGLTIDVVPLVAPEMTSVAVFVFPVFPVSTVPVRGLLMARYYPVH